MVHSQETHELQPYDMSLLTKLNQWQEFYAADN